MSGRIVIYFSKYGATKQYADWLAESLDAEQARLDEIGDNKLEWYDTVIIGCGKYAAGLKIKKFLLKNKDVLSTKRVVIFAVGASPADHELKVEIENETFKKGIPPNYSFWLLRGAFDYDRLSIDDKALMTIYLKTLKKENALDEKSRAIIECREVPQSWVFRPNLEPMLEFIQCNSKA